MIKTIVGVVVATLVVICAFMFIDPNSGSPVTGGGTSTDKSSSTYTVSVEGEVNRAGSYVLSDGATISDLIEAAGGVTDYADPLAYFEDAEVKKGATYYIANKYDISDICSLTELDKVNINEDDVETISSVKVISNTVASSIVSYRNEHGDYRTLEDILDVYGIGNATYNKIRNYLTLHA